jgi:hypothetical protein
MSAISHHLPLQAIDPKRRRALVVPREHGAWGILLIPLMCGASVGLMNGGGGGYLLPFAVAAFTLYWLRTPLESWLGHSPMKAQTPDEIRLVQRTATELSLISLVTVGMLFWGGANLGLLWFGLAAGAAAIAQGILKRSRNSRVLAEIVGAAGLASTGPSAYYLAMGRMDRAGWTIWIACFLFAANQIHYVQTRIRLAKPMPPREKLVAGSGFLLAQIALTVAITIVCFAERPFWLVVLAFIPTLYRGFAWFIRSPEPLKIHALGWSEMRQALAFGLLLIAGFAIARHIS